MQTTAQKCEEVAKEANQIDALIYIIQAVSYFIQVDQYYSIFKTDFPYVLTQSIHEHHLNTNEQRFS